MSKRKKIKIVFNGQYHWKLKRIGILLGETIKFSISWHILQISLFIVRLWIFNKLIYLLKNQTQLNTDNNAW